jgi:hypothetical protein
MLMSLRTRLARLERTRRPPSGTSELTDREWLAKFEGMGSEGVFINEPDFEDALAIYRAEIERHDPETLAWEWISEMYWRVLHRMPPLGEAEFKELADWYRRNEGVLYDPNLRAPVGLDPTDAIARRMGATEYAQRLRVLRARFPGLP